ncbi:DUF3219 family protein [Bacillus lacus]|uniref:DUF3219 family protein n=1 Tax=Metabacillus lacus TaxID=1983721 RepID=A0A7X2IXB3_9BACI|nr:DUF3219 family protein [Metabacillus lacus]MRX71537.1 DUF3219 family protein [Metabacillus lacus]
MVHEILLNGTSISVHRFAERKVDSLKEISIGFEVTHERYHEITTLLYKGTFDVTVPEKQISFRGAIREYSTSVTNLYEKGQVGDFSLTLLEVKK